MWFNYTALGSESDQDKQNIKEICTELEKLIAEESRTIPLNRIILGGYSIGGAIALHLGYRFLPNIAAVFCLSSFISPDSDFYHNIKSTSSPLFMSAGVNDNVISPEWSKKTFSTLQEAGVNGQFDTFQGKHELKKEELENLIQWIWKIMPN